jgi:hypothetical protein
MTRPRELRLIAVALVLPVVIVVIALGIVIAWLPQLPATVVVHWGVRGPDGFGPRESLPAVLAVVGLGIPFLCGGIILASRVTVVGLGHKAIAVVSLGTAIVVSVVVLAAVATQRGESGPAHAPSLTPWVLGGFAASVLLGVVAWFVMPRWTRPVEVWQVAPPLTLNPEERAVWLGVARFPLPLLAVLLMPGVILGGVVANVIAREGGLSWALVIVPPLITAALIGSADWRVRVDAGGLRVRSVLGFPAWNIPFDDITEAGTTSVQALPEFGGWGIRWAGRGRLGLITRSGAALEVHRRSGASLVVTVDDAATAAALLTAQLR